MEVMDICLWAIQLRIISTTTPIAWGDFVSVCEDMEAFKHKYTQ